MEWKKMFHKSRVYPVVLVGLMYLYWVFYLDPNLNAEEPFEEEVEQVQELKRFQISGTTMGTIPYSVIYIDTTVSVLKPEVDSVLNQFNTVFSTYITESEISTFNASEVGGVYTDEFIHVVKAALGIAKNTEGAFDPTVFPLVQIWGFGPNKERVENYESEISQALRVVGYQKLLVQSDTSIMKEPGVTIDLSAIAKGYASDVVTNYLKSRGVVSGFVEIGGEVFCFGKKRQDKSWNIGIVSPSKEKGIEKLLAVDGLGVATSGNYEQVRYEEDGSAYSHTIDPRTGQQIKSKVLSATVVASTCMEADAYATACMVLGVEKSAELIGTIEGVELYLMYDENGEMKFFETEGLKQFYND